MKLSIVENKSTDECFIYVLERLPLKIRNLLNEYCKINNFHFINEIRIKRNANLYLIADSKTVKSSLFISDYDINEIFEYICNHSLYAYAETIKEGYVPIGLGIRAGICGNAILENGKIIGINEISSINIRIPQKISNASSFVYSFLKNERFLSSVLIYSLPGVGKTSILRDLILKLNNDESLIRFSVIDTRDEIVTPFMKNLSCDVYSLYPKGLGIELATRSMTPEIIICDEISNENDANAILKAVNSGVKIIATTHASTLNELKRKEILKNLLNASVFDHFIGVERKNSESKYKFTLD